MLFLHQILKVTSFMTGAYYTESLGGTLQKMKSVLTVTKNLVWESHHSLGKNLNATGIMF